MKKLMGKKEVEDAVLRLDMLTREESLMVLVGNLEITNRVDGVVQEVDGNVKATKVLTEGIDCDVKSSKALTEDTDGNVKATKVLTEDIDDNVKAIQGVARNVDNGTLSVLVLRSYTDIFPIVSQQSHTRA